MGTKITRNGAPLRQLPDGAPRRMSDGKNAWRKMNSRQRSEFLTWIAFGHPGVLALESVGRFNSHDLREAVAALHYEEDDR